MNNIKNKIRGQIAEPIQLQLKNGSTVWKWIGDPIQVGDLIRDCVENKVSVHVGSHVWGRVWDQVGGLEL